MLPTTQPLPKFKRYWEINRCGVCVCVGRLRLVGGVYWSVVLPSEQDSPINKGLDKCHIPVQSNITYPCGGPRRSINAISCYPSDSGPGVLRRDTLHIFIILKVSPRVSDFQVCLKRIPPGTAAAAAAQV